MALTLRYEVKYNDVSKNDFLIGEGFRIHPQATMGMSWAEVFFKSRSYERGGTIKIYFDGTLAFEGLIKRERQDTKQWTAIAYDKLYRWRDEPCIDAGYYEYTNQLAGTVLVDLLSHYLSGEFDTSNVDAGGTITHIDGYGMYVYDFAQEIARRVNYDFWLEPPNKVYFKAEGTLSTGVVIVYGTDILDILVEKDDLSKRDKIIVQGRRFVEATAGTGNAKHFHMDDNILTVAQSQEVANALLTKKNVTLVTGDVQLKNYKPEIRAGKTLVVDAPRYGFGSETVRITAVVHTPSGTKFTMGDAWSTMNEISNLLSIEDRLLESGLQLDSDKIYDNRGTVFPASPFDHQRYYRTDQGRTYRWNEGTSEWIPMDFTASGDRILDAIITYPKIHGGSGTMSATLAKLAKGTDVIGVNSTSWQTVREYELMPRAGIKHRLQECIADLRTTLATEQAQLKVETNVNFAGWVLFDSIKVTNSTTFVEKVFTDVVTTGVNEKLGIRFMARSWDAAVLVEVRGAKETDKLALSQVMDIS